MLQPAYVTTEHMIPTLPSSVFLVTQHVLCALQVFLILAQPAALFTTCLSPQRLATQPVLIFTSIISKILPANHVP